MDAHAGRRDDRRARGATPANVAAGQAARAARLADPVHRPRRADRLLRRRGRRDRRRRPGRPAHVPVGRHWAARPTRRCSPTTRRSPRCGDKVTGADATATSGVLLADDAAADGRLRPADRRSQAAIVALNRSDVERRRSTIPVGGYRARRHVARRRFGVGVRGVGSVVGRRRRSTSRSPPMSRRSCSRPARRSTCKPPAAPTGLRVTGEGDGTVVGRVERRRRRGRLRRLAQPAVGRRLREGERRAASRARRSRSPASRNAGARTTTSSARSTRPATPSGPRTRSSALPHLDDRLGEPAVAADADPHDLGGEPDGQRLRPGLDRRRDEPARRRRRRSMAQLGFGPDGSNPAGNAGWTWVDAALQHRRRQQRRVRRVAAARRDGHVRLRLPLHRRPTAATGSTPTSTAIGNGYSPAQAGLADRQLERRHDRAGGARPGSTSSPPRRPGSSSPGMPSPATRRLYGYEVRRSATAGGPYTTHRAITATTSPTPASPRAQTYFYVVRSVDTSFNRSGPSAEVTATAELRTVTLTFNVTVPATTDGDGPVGATSPASSTGSTAACPQWDPGAVSLTRVDATHWTITFTGKESDPDRVQVHARRLGPRREGRRLRRDRQPAADAELRRARARRRSTTRSQNWRNVAPCGN